MAIMPRGGDIYKIWGFIHLSVSIIRGKGKIGGYIVELGVNMSEGGGFKSRAK